MHELLAPLMSSSQNAEVVFPVAFGGGFFRPFFGMLIHAAIKAKKRESETSVVPPWKKQGMTPFP